MTITTNPSNNRRAEADTMTTMQTAPVQIDIENLSLSFGKTEVLKGVNLAIRPGEFFAFLGPSGSGKSTLLRAIAGFGPNPKGQIKLDGQDIVGSVPWQRNVGMVFQSYALWPHMTVAKNVAFGLEERKVPSSEIGPKVRAALELVGMADYAERFPSQLSGGQQQRVALARTIVVEPRVLLLDEPLSNLDANLRVQMRQDLLKLQRRLGITTIFVTHDQEEANTICDRIAVMADGVVQQIGRPDEVYDNPPTASLQNSLAPQTSLKVRSSFPGMAKASIVVRVFAFRSVRTKQPARRGWWCAQKVSSLATMGQKTPYRAWSHRPSSLVEWCAMPLISMDRNSWSMSVTPVARSGWKRGKALCLNLIPLRRF